MTANVVKRGSPRYENEFFNLTIGAIQQLRHLVGLTMTGGGEKVTNDDMGGGGEALCN